jgi:hypothetical protein
MKHKQLMASWLSYLSNKNDRHYRKSVDPALIAPLTSDLWKKSWLVLNVKIVSKLENCLKGKS